MADRLLITKCDLPTPLFAALCQRLRALNPGAQQLEVSAAWLRPTPSSAAVLRPAGKTPDVSACLVNRPCECKPRATPRSGAGRCPPAAAQPAAEHSRHDATSSSFVLVFDEPLRWFDFSDALDVLLRAYGTRIPAHQGLAQHRRRSVAAGTAVRAAFRLSAHQPCRLSPGSRPTTIAAAGWCSLSATWRKRRKAILASIGGRRPPPERPQPSSASEPGPARACARPRRRKAASRLLRAMRLICPRQTWRRSRVDEVLAHIAAEIRRIVGVDGHLDARLEHRLEAVVGQGRKHAQLDVGE